jgi:hypothetical protein
MPIQWFNAAIFFVLIRDKIGFSYSITLFLCAFLLRFNKVKRLFVDCNIFFQTIAGTKKQQSFNTVTLNDKIPYFCASK